MGKFYLVKNVQGGPSLILNKDQFLENYDIL